MFRFRISQLTSLPGNVIDHIFDYLAVGEIFYSFYHLNSVRRRRNSRTNFFLLVLSRFSS